MLVLLFVAVSCSRSATDGVVAGGIGGPASASSTDPGVAID